MISCISVFNLYPIGSMKKLYILIFSSLLLISGVAKAQTMTVDTIGSYTSTHDDLSYVNQSNKICYVRSATYHTLWCYNLNNVIFKPLGGQVRIYSDTYFCWLFESQATNITIDGSGVPGFQYGFKLYGSVVQPGVIDFKDSSRNRVIKNIEVGGGIAQGTGGVGINLAIYPKNNGTVLTRQNGFTMGNDTIVNSYIHGTYVEGVYEGCSHYGLNAVRGLTPVPAEAPVDTFYFANNIIDTCGQSGMNCSGVRGLATITNNSISHWALHNAYGHTGAITLGPGSRPLISNNKFFSETTSDIPAQGVSYQGVGGSIYNNEFTGVYFPLIILRNTDGSNNLHIPDINIYNNTIVKSHYGLYVFGNNLDAGAVHYKNNISADNDTDIYANGKDFSCLDSGYNVYGTSARIKLLDPANRNYALMAGSPAIGEGTDLSAMVKTDIYFNPRTLPFDAGAEKYGGIAGDSTPIAIPGKDSTLPSNATNLALDGSASYDPDGIIVAYKWTLVSGAMGAQIINPDSSKTQITGLAPGTYVLQLKVTDSLGAVGAAEIKITVLLPPNQLPVANAGADISFALPINYTTLNGSASYDPDGAIANYNWTQFAGPAAATIANPTAISTGISGLQQGVYSFVLTVMDNRGGTSSDTINVTVNPGPPPPPNHPPVANAGPDISITLPTSSAVLDGSQSTDPDGTITSYNWIKIAGPSQYAIGNSSAASTGIINLVQGVYTFVLTVTDNGGLTAADTVLVTVNPAPNQPPVANAGTDISLTLPVDSTHLDGTGSYDPDGTIASYSWNKLSGPGAITIGNSNTATPLVLGLQAGQYVFELTVTDNSGASSKSSVTVTVGTGVLIVPVANAGRDTIIYSPNSVAVLNGTSSYSPNGSISKYLWHQVSGPASAQIVQASQSATYAQQLVAGSYIFELTVTDNLGNTAKDSIMVTVAVNFRFTGSVKVYPNPLTSSTITIDITNDIMGKVKISMVDMNGRLVQQGEFDKQSASFRPVMPLPTLAKGTYILNIWFPGATSAFVYKLIKQ
jgi:hypothetical protein